MALLGFICSGFRLFLSILGHDVLELRPQRFDGAKLIADLHRRNAVCKLLDANLFEFRLPYRNYSLQAAVEFVYVLKDMFEALYAENRVRYRVCFG